MEYLTACASNNSQCNHATCNTCHNNSAKRALHHQCIATEPIIRDSCRIWSSWACVARTARVAWDAWSTRISGVAGPSGVTGTTHSGLPLCNKNNLRVVVVRVTLTSCWWWCTVKLPSFEDITITSWNGCKTVSFLGERVSGVAYQYRSNCSKAAGALVPPFAS